MIIIKTVQLKLDAIYTTTPAVYYMCDVCKESKTVDQNGFCRGKRHKYCNICAAKKEMHREKTHQTAGELYRLENCDPFAGVDKSIISDEDRLRIITERKEAIGKLKRRLDRLSNWEKCRAKERKFLKTPKGKVHQIRASGKRRSLGFEPINQYFEGSEYHHLRYDANGKKDNNIGMFIPTKLHRTFRHSGTTAQGMEIINNSAFDWYNSHMNQTKVT